MNIKITHNTRDNISAKIVEYHIPFNPKASGNSNTQPVWKIKVLQVDDIAEIKPLFNAVKNVEVNVFNPYNMNEKAYILMAFVVNSTRLSLYPTNNFASGIANAIDNIVIDIPVKMLITILFFNIFLISSLFFAP